MRRGRWIVFAPLIAFLIPLSSASADTQNGLQAVGYTFPSSGIPTKSDALYETCGSELENNINRNFNGEPFQECGDDLFMIHYTGFITIPENNTISFMIAADDGGTINIGGTEFGTWNNKGCSWSAITTNAFPAGSYPLDGWFYEWGGGTCFMLAWNIDETGWEIVPDSAFSTEETSVTTTTTTTVSQTTVPETTTTLPEETSTTTEPPTTTTTIAYTTTTSAETTTTTTSTTTTSTTTTTTTTTTTVYVPTATTTTEPELEEETETTNPVPDDETAETTIFFQSVFPETSIPDDSVYEEPVDTDQQENTDPVVETEEEEEVVSQAEIIALETEAEEQQELEAQVAALIEEITTMSAEEITATDVKAILEVIEELSEEQIDELVAVLSDAPDEAKEVFEESVDVYSGQFDEYVPAGSVITVAERRIISAVTATLFVLPAPVSASAGSRRKQ